MWRAKMEVQLLIEVGWKKWVTVGFCDLAVLTSDILTGTDMKIDAFYADVICSDS